LDLTTLNTGYRKLKISPFCYLVRVTQYLAEYLHSHCCIISAVMPKERFLAGEVSQQTSGWNGQCQWRERSLFKYHSAQWNNSTSVRWQEFWPHTTSACNGRMDVRIHAFAII